MRTDEWPRHPGAERPRNTRGAFGISRADLAFADIWAPDFSRSTGPCNRMSQIERDTEELLRDWYAARARREGV
jgi:hypothetical protein